jgi:hypothetical protein
MKTQQQAHPVKKFAIAVLGIVLPLATLSASLPATAHGHFFGHSLGRSSNSDHRSDSQDNSDYSFGRHRSHRFFFVNEHLFEHYNVFYRLDNNSPWLKDESYRSRDEAELEVRRLEHNGYIAKLVRE